MEKIKEIYMYLLGAFVVALCFFLAYLLIFTPVPESNQGIVNVAFGLVLGWGGAVVGYFFGTSKSSAEKTKMIANGHADK
jgi:uncharacterized membrane protein YjfL (UPF0719 family)